MSISHYSRDNTEGSKDHAINYLSSNDVTSKDLMRSLINQRTSNNARLSLVYCFHSIFIAYSFSLYIYIYIYIYRSFYRSFIAYMAITQTFECPLNVISMASKCPLNVLSMKDFYAHLY